MSRHKHQRRHAYLLRCWQEESRSFGDTIEWRFSVEEVLNEKWRRGFASIQDLFDFLEAELTCTGHATSESGCDDDTTTKPG